MPLWKSLAEMSVRGGKYDILMTCLQNMGLFMALEKLEEIQHESTEIKLGICAMFLGVSRRKQ